MNEVLVLGQIPGTNIQISFFSWLLSLAAILFCAYFYRKYSSVRRRVSLVSAAIKKLMRNFLSIKFGLTYLKKAQKNLQRQYIRKLRPRIRRARREVIKAYRKRARKIKKLENAWMKKFRAKFSLRPARSSR